MKKLLTFFSALLILSLNTSGQILHKGYIFDIKTNKQVFLELTVDTPSVAIISSKKMLFYKINDNGVFYVPENDIQNFDNRVGISIRLFYSNNFNFADYEIKNVPKDSLLKFISKIYLSPAYWTPSCGNDCFTIDNKKTFRKKEFLVMTDFFKYKIRRVPKKINQSLLDVHYETDFDQDIIK